MRQTTPTQVFKILTNHVFFGLALAGMAGTLGSAAQAQGPDGHDLLEKTLRAYHDLSSYDGQASYDVDVVGGAKGKKATLTSTTSSMKFKRPNKLQIKMTTAKGSLDFYSDGSRMAAYRPGVQKYILAPAAPDMIAMQPAMLKLAGLFGQFDPLYFLCNTSLPATLSNYKTQGTGSVNGHPVYIVSASYKPQPVKQVQNPFLQASGNWTFYIDKSNYLLQKVEAQVPVNIKQTAIKNKKKVETSLAGAFKMRHAMTNAKPNEPIDDSQFVFTPPKGATEQKEASALIREHGAGK